MDTICIYLNAIIDHRNTKAEKSPPAQNCVNVDYTIWTFSIMFCNYYNSMPISRWQNCDLYNNKEKNAWKSGWSHFTALLNKFHQEKIERYFLKDSSLAIFRFLSFSYTKGRTKVDSLTLCLVFANIDCLLLLFSRSVFPKVVHSVPWCALRA